MLLDDWLLHTGRNKWQVSEKRNFIVNETNVGFVKNYRDYKTMCKENDVLFVSFDKAKAFYKCDYKNVFDRKFWDKARGAEFYIDNGRLKYLTVTKYVGNRPWAYEYKDSKDTGFDYVFAKFKK